MPAQFRNLNHSVHFLLLDRRLKAVLVEADGVEELLILAQQPVCRQVQLSICLIDPGIGLRHRRLSLFRVQAVLRREFSFPLSHFLVELFRTGRKALCFYAQPLALQVEGITLARCFQRIDHHAVGVSYLAGGRCQFKILRQACCTHLHLLLVFRASLCHGLRASGKGLPANCALRRNLTKDLRLLRFPARPAFLYAKQGTDVLTCFLTDPSIYVCTALKLGLRVRRSQLLELPLHVTGHQLSPGSGAGGKGTGKSFVTRGEGCINALCRCHSLRLYVDLKAPAHVFYAGLDSIRSFTRPLASGLPSQVFLLHFADVGEGALKVFEAASPCWIRTPAPFVGKSQLLQYGSLIRCRRYAHCLPRGSRCPTHCALKSL